MKKRFLSCFMALALCLTLLPTAALAEETEGTAQTSPAVEESADPANGEAKQENQPAETKQENQPAETKQESQPAEAKQENQPAETEQKNQPAEQGEQQEDSAAKQAVADVQALIDALPDAEALDGMDDEDAMAVYEAFQAACDAYYDLTEEQQAQLKNTEKLAALSGWFSQPAALAETTENVKYGVVNESGQIAESTYGRNCVIVTSSSTPVTWTTGWYAVKGEVTINGDLTVSGGTSALDTVSLILCDGAELTVNGSVTVTEEFCIYGQKPENDDTYTGTMYINHTGSGAAIRAGVSGRSVLTVSGGRLEVESSGTAVEGVKLFNSENRFNIMKCTTGDERPDCDGWVGEDSFPSAPLVIEQCDHYHEDDSQVSYFRYTKGDDGTHTKTCTRCGFRWAAENCEFIYGWGKADASGHYGECICGNVSETSTPHEITCKPTDNGQGHTQRCRVCFYTPNGEPVLAHEYDMNGVCENCGFKPVARDEAGNLYESVGDALKAAADGSWVILETQAEDKAIDEHIEFNRPGKTVELKMNGYTLTNSGNPTLTVENGTLKITGDAVINQTGTFPDLAAPAVKVNGGKVIFEGNLTAHGGTYSYGNRTEQKPAVYADGGELDFNGGLTLYGGLTLTKSAALANKLTQGTFTAIEGSGASRLSVEGSNTYTCVRDLLFDGHAYALAADKTKFTQFSGAPSCSDDVTVVEHMHTWAQDETHPYLHSCVCGASENHQYDSSNGACTICHSGCPHEDVDNDGTCKTCHARMLVKIENGGTVTYTTDFKAAMKAAEDGTTVTLLADIELGTTPQSRAEITGDGKIVTLDLNGHKITSGWLDVGGKDTNGTYTACTLKIIGKGSYEPPMYGGLITVDVKATLDLSRWEGGTISSINISDNSGVNQDNPSAREAAVIVGSKAGTIGKLTFGNNQLGELKKTKLSGGKFNEIWAANHQPVKLGDLLVSGYALQHDDGSYEKYTTTLQNRSIYNVKVIKCPHADAEGGTCLYCGKTGILARVGSKTYDNVGTAVSEWLDGSVQGTLKLFTDYGEGFDANALDLISAKAEWLAIDLNGHGFYKDCQGDIKLGGGKRLTITDSKEKTGSQGAFGPIDADRGTLTLESGHLQGLRVSSSSSATILLWGGKVTSISCPVPIFNLLPDGYALMDDSGLPVDPTITIYDSKTYTVKDSTNLYISSQNEGSAAIGSDTIPLALSLKTGDGTIGLMRFEWYIVKENGTTQKLAATTSDVTPGADGVYTCNAANMTVVPNGWTDLIVGKTYDVLCVVTGKTSDGTSSKWRTPMRGYKLTVEKIDLANAEVTISSWPTDGTVRFDPFYPEQSVFNIDVNTITVKANNTEYTLSDDDYTCDGATATRVGKYKLTITATDSCANYKGSKTFDWEVTPCQLYDPGYLGSQTYTKTYDGTATLPESYQFYAYFRYKGVYDNVDWRDDTSKSNYEVTAAEFVSPDAGENKPINQTITLKNENFVFAPTEMINVKGITTTDKTMTYTNFTIEEAYGRNDTTFNIEKATMPDVDNAVTLEVINDHADTYMVDLAALLPKLTGPMKYGDVAYALGTDAISFRADGYYKEGTAKIEGGKLILPIQAAAEKKEGSIGKIAVTVSSTNIEDFALKIHVSAANKTIPTGGGSSSGGGGGSDRDNSGSTGKTETTTKPDGTTVKTETRADGTKVETTTGKDGSTSKTTTNPNGSSVTETKAADGSTGTVKTDKSGQTTAETTLSAKALEDAKKNGEAVKAPVEVEASRNSSTAPTVSIELPKGAGETKVEIPVSNVKPGTVAVIVHPDGTEEIVKNSVPTEDGIQLTVDGNATVKIVDNSKNFTDTAGHWSEKNIDFVSARGLLNGTSADRFSPNAPTTRAQLWTILARQNDADISGGANWYEKAQLWSKDKGISDGTNPNAAINRAQMVTMLWRTMGQPAATDKVSFADVPAGSYYAQAVAWAVESGITQGVGGDRFDPNATCTRAQIAAFLARYMK